MSNQFDPKTSVQVAKRQLENDSERHRLKHEIIKRFVSQEFFGFLVILIMVIAGLIVSMRWSDIEVIKGFWTIITPLISAYIGYAIGRKSSE